MSKYKPFIDHLRACSKDHISFTFSEIESIIDDKLPPSSKQRPVWWANSTHRSHSWAVGWLEAGWMKDNLDLDIGTVSFRRAVASLTHDADSPEAIEGYMRDQRVLTRSRNRAIVDRARQRDDYRCRACQFQLHYYDRYVIDAHHRTPLALTDDTATQLDDLVCLCPTCHRIAHLRSPEPLAVHEIIAVRSDSGTG